jgi:ribonuclease I|tara:strand:+ start:10236 stop:10439 length:204 start_codon:yes stop_codon:yes gene_type:complete
MSYPTIEYFNKIVKNAKNIRQQEVRLETDKALLLALEIAEVMSAKFPKEEKEKLTLSTESLFDGGKF